ncbi:MAG: mechanosensitive ion channel family protein [Pleurocapsa sp. MO_192.B19]|nr:mechanosensitive ion channel family protein [Pleurocapsa sp. MO_192.B19]
MGIINIKHMLRIGWLQIILRRGIKVFILALVFNFLLIFPLKAQLPFLPQITWETFKFNQNPENTMISACVRLDGRCVFSILDQKSNLAQRIKYTEERLKDISRSYFKQDTQLKVYSQEQGSQENIYVSVGDRQVPVITLYPKDATARGVNLKHQAQQIANELDFGLRRAKEERKRAHLIEQAKLAGIIALFILLGELAVADGLKRLKKVKTKLQSGNFSLPQPFGEYVNQEQKLNLRLLQYRLLQVLQIGLWLGGSLLILNLFPQTRSLQLWLITLIRIPLRITLVGLATYILIRFSNVLIAKLNHTLAENYVMTRDVKRRMQVRIMTITRLLGGMIAIFWIVLGILIALTLIGINVTPLLAGAGILGLAFSFASQNIIKDALNGFLIILEDQYAVGDVINVGEVGGLVENLNLRITQLRDGQGRLITIPNSEIRTVANLSSQWSRAEIDIPIAYQAEIDRALKLISQVAQEMDRESDWQDKIIETPEVLGVDNFSDRGSVVRIWIKTEPLKQWEVAREFRRRLQKTFEKHNIPLPVSQQKVWLER